MSMLVAPEPVPSRILAIYRFLLGSEGRKLPRVELEDLLSPKSLRRQEGGSLISTCVGEAIGLGLLRETGGAVELPSENVVDISGNLDPFRDLILSLLAKDTCKSHDLLTAMAWLVDSDPDFKDTHEALRLKLEKLPPAANKLGITNPDRTEMLRHWSTFLGCSRPHIGASIGSVVFVPDLAPVLRRHLKALFTELGKTVSLIQARAYMATRCPVWPGGSAHQEISAYLPQREKLDLSWAESQAWMFLDESRAIKLLKRDIESFRFNLGSDRPAFNTIQQGNA